MEPRAVRPRLAGAEVLASGSSSVPPSRGIVSPLVGLLVSAVAGGKVVKDSTGKIFTGFASYGDLAESRCKFVPMNSNRAISRDVVKKRVAENLQIYMQTGQYMEFGQINLIIIAQDATYDFLVMDGQHRCETMDELYRHPAKHDITFQFRAKVVSSEADAFEELKHFQRSYPTDNRSFFRSRAEARAATAVLLKIKEEYGSAFRDMVLSDQRGRATKDPVRPYLNDNIVFWLLQDAGLVGGADANAGDSQAGSADGARALALLLRMNIYMATLVLTDLGRGATAKMRQNAGAIGCWLGFFREGVLHWGDLRQKMENDTAEQMNILLSHAGSAEASPTEENSCIVCLDRPKTHAFMPCGHRCVCETCGEAVRAQRPSECPVCRQSIHSVQRIY